MESCWLFSCRQLDSKETYLANVSTRCSSPPQARLSFTLALRRTGASGQNIGKISFFAVKLSTREQSATFQGDNNCYHGLCGGNIIETNTEQINTHICPKLRHNKIPLCVGTIHLIRVGRQASSPGLTVIIVLTAVLWFPLSRHVYIPSSDSPTMAICRVLV